MTVMEMPLLDIYKNRGTPAYERALTKHQQQFYQPYTKTTLPQRIQEIYEKSGFTYKGNDDSYTVSNGTFKVKKKMSTDREIAWRDICLVLLDYLAKEGE